MSTELRRIIKIVSVLVAHCSLLSLPAQAATPWSGILSPSRAIDWSQSGLPATLPDGETTPNPWTPPTRTKCVTAACNTVGSGGANVTVANINAALASASAGQYVLVPPGNYSLSGTINLVSHVTLRGSGAQATQLNGATFNTGNAPTWAGASLLSGSIAKGATSVTIANGQTIPTAGRMVGLTQCMTGSSAPDATFTSHGTVGSGSNCDPLNFTPPDPLGPWVCGGDYPYCARNNNGRLQMTNPHYMGQIFWIPAGGISGNTVTLSQPIMSPLWSTANSASLAWASSPGNTGVGMEDFTSGWIRLRSCYGCWMKGLRLIYTGGDQYFTQWTSNSLIMNSYYTSTAGVGGGAVQAQMGQEDDVLYYDNNILFLNNIIVGIYLEEDGGQQGYVQAYNWWANNNLGSQTYSGDFPHNPGGAQFMLREGNMQAFSWDDDTWTTHNWDTWFRNWIAGYDFSNGTTVSIPMDVGGFSRFDNVIGNVDGSPQAGLNPYSTVMGLNRNGIDTTGLTAASLMRWGNYFYCSGDAAHCQVATGAFDNAEVPSNLSSFGPNSTPYQNPVPADHNLPASFFMNVAAHPNGGTGLSWWKTCASWTTFPTACASYSTPPFPPMGPDVTGGPYMNGHVYDNPAAIAWKSLPLDSGNFPGTTIRMFDESVYQGDSSGPTGGACLNACDVNCDGSVNVSDVQAEINMALGKATCPNQSGACNVVSVQKVINAALGGTCVAP